MYWGSLMFSFQGQLVLWRIPSEGVAFAKSTSLRLLMLPVISQHRTEENVGKDRKKKKKRTKGWRSIDLYSRNLCRQTEHPSCCAEPFQTARGPWSTCRTPRPRSSPPPLGWCSSQLGWSGGPALWRKPVRKRERPGRVRWGEKLEPQTIPMAVGNESFPLAGTCWCCLKPKLNLAASFLKAQSPLRLAARICKKNKSCSDFHFEFQFLKTRNPYMRTKALFFS